MKNFLKILCLFSALLFLSADADSWIDDAKPWHFTNLTSDGWDKNGLPTPKGLNGTMMIGEIILKSNDTLYMPKNPNIMFGDNITFHHVDTGTKYERTVKLAIHPIDDPGPTSIQITLDRPIEFDSDVQSEGEYYRRLVDVASWREDPKPWHFTNLTTRQGQRENDLLVLESRNKLVMKNFPNNSLAIGDMITFESCKTKEMNERKVLRVESIAYQGESDRFIVIVFMPSLILINENVHTPKWHRHFNETEITVPPTPTSPPTKTTPTENKPTPSTTPTPTVATKEPSDLQSTNVTLSMSTSPADNDGKAVKHLEILAASVTKNDTATSNDTPEPEPEPTPSTTPTMTTTPTPTVATKKPSDLQSTNVTLSEPEPEPEPPIPKFIDTPESTPEQTPATSTLSKTIIWVLVTIALVVLVVFFGSLLFVCLYRRRKVFNVSERSKMLQSV